MPCPIENDHISDDAILYCMKLDVASYHTLPSCYLARASKRLFVVSDITCSYMTIDCGWLWGPLTF